MVQNNKILVIAEVANAHEGSADTALELIEAAARAGADAVKFQRFTADELLVKQHSRFSHFKALEMADADWQRLFCTAKEKGLLFFSDVFGTESLAAMKRLGVDGIKIHSSDLPNEPLLRNLRDWDRYLFISCGGASEKEILGALRAAQVHGGREKTFLLHGFQNFPTSLEETHLRRIPYLARTFGLPVGFMDHVDAEQPLARSLPLAAVGGGAVVIEKHITRDRSRKGIDYYSSLEPAEFEDFVRQVRDLEKTLGEGRIVFSPQEQLYRKKMKKALVARRDLKAGTVLTAADVDFKRAEEDCFSLGIQDVEGKTLAHDVNVEDVIRWKHLRLKTGIMIVARMSSRRLPGKAVAPIHGRPALAYLFERARLSRTAEVVVMCTSRNPADDPIAALAQECGVVCFRGDEDNVLSRVLGACRQENVDIAVRVTGDDILLSPEHLDRAVEHLQEVNADYCHNKALPGGTECEVFTTGTLETIARYAQAPENTEYLTYFIQNENFQRTELAVPSQDQSDLDLTLDQPEDLEAIAFLLKNIYDPQRPFTQQELQKFISLHHDRFKKKRTGVTKEQSGINCELQFDLAGERR